MDKVIKHIIGVSVIVIAILMLFSYEHYLELSKPITKQNTDHAVPKTYKYLHKGNYDNHEQIGQLGLWNLDPSLSDISLKEREYYNNLIKLHNSTKSVKEIWVDNKIVVESKGYSLIDRYMMESQIRTLIEDNTMGFTSYTYLLSKDKKIISKYLNERQRLLDDNSLYELDSAINYIFTYDELESKQLKLSEDTTWGIMIDTDNHIVKILRHNDFDKINEHIEINPEYIVNALELLSAYSSEYNPIRYNSNYLYTNEKALNMSNGNIIDTPEEIKIDGVGVNIIDGIDKYEGYNQKITSSLGVERKWEGAAINEFRDPERKVIITKERQEEIREGVSNAYSAGTIGFY